MINPDYIAKKHFNIFLVYEALFRDLGTHDTQFKSMLKEELADSKVLSIFKTPTSHQLTDCDSTITDSGEDHSLVHESKLNAISNAFNKKDAQRLIIYLQSFIDCDDFKKRKFMINAIKYPHIAISHQLICDSGTFVSVTREIISNAQRNGVMLSHPAESYVSQVQRRAHSTSRSKHLFTFKAFRLMVSISLFLNADAQRDVREAIASLGYVWAQDNKKIDIQNITNFAKDQTDLLAKDTFAILQTLQDTRNLFLYNFTPVTERQFKDIVIGAKAAMHILKLRMLDFGLLADFEFPVFEEV